MQSLIYRGFSMKISKKTTILLTLLFLMAAGGGYYLWHQKKAENATGDEQAAHGPVLYTCPMHPFIIKDKPGSCPICGMTLVKKVQAAQSSAKEMQALEQVSISPTQMVMANVATVEAKVMPLAKEINAVGTVQYDQARQSRVTAWVAGRIDRLYVNKVGDYVTTKRPVAEIYSPDLLATQQEYLLALKSREQLKNSPISSIAQGGEGLVASARQRLKLWGVKDRQIAELEKAGQPNVRLPIYTTLSGIVIEKLVLDGQYVKEGDTLFSIADLSSVWTELEVYENEFSFIKMGQRVEIASQSYPGKSFSGRVSYIYPFLDPKTRTLKVRVEMPNPGLKLKPDMFVNAKVKVPLGNVMAVPVAAVMDTGSRQVVWIEVKEGTFEPRNVKIGARAGDYLQILSGLKQGEKVAASGGYLIDSEAQLKGGGGHAGHEGMPGMKMDEKSAPKPAAPAPKSGGMDMKDMKM
jgi:Cu(I)/Ag(I) efflux system membrane fusion protein